MDRHGLSALAMTTHFVIARRERSEGRGNPSCLGESGRVGGSVTEDQWIATGYALAMTIIGEKERSELIFHSSPIKLHSSFTGFFGGIRGSQH